MLYLFRLVWGILSLHWASDSMLLLLKAVALEAIRQSADPAALRSSGADLFKRAKSILDRLAVSLKWNCRYGKTLTGFHLRLPVQPAIIHELQKFRFCFALQFGVSGIWTHKDFKSHELYELTCKDSLLWICASIRLYWYNVLLDCRAAMWNIFYKLSSCTYRGSSTQKQHSQKHSSDSSNLKNSDLVGHAKCDIIWLRCRPLCLVHFTAAVIC